MINAGRLDQLITLQRRASGVDALGQESVTWANLDSDPTVWASASTARGKEFFAAGEVRSEARVVFRIRYRSDVLHDSATLRVVWDGEIYDVTEPPQDVDGAHVAIDLFGSTGARDGR